MEITHKLIHGFGSWDPVRLASSACPDEFNVQILLGRRHDEDLR
jgi:hypothetical protein